MMINSLLPHVKPGHDVLLQNRRGQYRRQRLYIPYIITASVAAFVSANIFFCLHLLDDASKPSNNAPETSVKKAASSPTCTFRTYPDHRYYKIENKSPGFLQGDYIFGEWPVILPTAASPHKLCVDQSEWLEPSQELPFADGTNPSIISVERWRDHLGDHQHAALPASLPEGAHYFATACMTDSQCKWSDSPGQVKEYRMSTNDKADTVRTVLFVLDNNFAVLSESTLFLEQDANWGKRVKAQKKNGTPVKSIHGFDDARLFIHDGDLWVSYREGRGFGYETQVLNKIHIEFSINDSMTSTLLASETTSFCCGRNMALMESKTDPHLLQSLTWVDPVTVIDVDTTPLTKRQKKNRRLLEIADYNNNHGRENNLWVSPNTPNIPKFDFLNTAMIHRGLGGSKKKSHIHGTNAFMVYWPTHDVFLGIAHFHRPNDRNKNPYARFGHHYTHTFYTVSAKAPFELTGLSPEWVLPDTRESSKDAEIIQFASGLEIIGDAFIVAYGINDCESGLVRLNGKDVWSMLRSVSPGQQVVDFMEPLKSR